MSRARDAPRGVEVCKKGVYFIALSSCVALYGELDGGSVG